MDQRIPIEIEDAGNLSKFVDQFNDNPANGALNLRRSAMYMANKKYGKVWLGLQSTAKDNIVKDTVIIKGLDQTMHADFYMNWSFFLRPEGLQQRRGILGITPRFRDIGRCYSTSSSAFDCSTRRNESATTRPSGTASWAAGPGARTTSGRRPCASRRSGTTGRSALATPMRTSPTSW